jgi:hypothetical protein
MDDIRLSKADVQLLREHKKCSMDYILKHLDDAEKDPVGFVGKFIEGLVNEVQIEEGTDILSDPSVFIGKADGKENRK